MDSESTERMRHMLRHRLLNIASGIKAATMFLESQDENGLNSHDREYFPLIRNECDGICLIVEQMDQMFGPVSDLSAILLQDALVAGMCAVREELPTAEVVFETEHGVGMQRVCRVVAVTTLREAVKNGWQASSQTVFVTACAQEKNIQLRIIDQGAGFSDEGKMLAFEPFYSTKTRSLGLGLSIARKQVVELGGSVSLGREARGNYVQFNLPFLA